MRIHLALFGVIGLSIFGSGCVYTDRSEDYLKADSIAKISLPNTVESTPLEPLYPIPEVTPRLDAFLETDIGGDGVPRPEPMSAEREAAKVKIQKVSGRQWLLIEAPASQVWPLAQSYLSSAGVGVVKSDAASGLIQTDWVQFKLDAINQSHFQLRIEKGVRPETTEVHILQHQKPIQAGDKGTGASDSNQSAWPKTSSDPEREFWLLESLANSLAQRIGNKAASLLGQSIGGKSKAELILHEGEPAIALRLSESRAWATLAHGLQKEEFIRWEENDNQGIFFVQYTGDYKRPNWFVRLFTWGNDKPVEVAPYSLSMAIQHLADAPEVRALMNHVAEASFGKTLSNGAGYLIVTTPIADGFVVRARDYKGERLELDHNKKLLAMLRRNLI